MTSKKVCSYKNCGLIQTSDRICTETFFQFPKDERRYQLWMELGRVEDEPHFKGIRYFCSKHFDAKKYIASNPRRKMLLSSAIPYEYKSEGEEDIDEEVVSEQEVERFFVEVDENSQEENCHLVESTINDEILHKESTIDNFIIDSRGDNSKKRRLSIEVDKITHNKADKIATEQEIKTMEYYESFNETDSEVTDDEIALEPSITEFMWQGVAYVKMPKKNYIDEKTELLKEIKYYKDIVASFKKQLQNVKI